MFKSGINKVNVTLVFNIYECERVVGKMWPLGGDTIRGSAGNGIVSLTSLI